jgi:hypothetical protein
MYIEKLRTTNVQKHLVIALDKSHDIDSARA